MFLGLESFCGRKKKGFHKSIYRNAWAIYHEGIRSEDTPAAAAAAAAAALGRGERGF